MTAELRELKQTSSPSDSEATQPLSDSFNGDAVDLLVARAQRFRERYEAEEVRFPHSLIVWAYRNPGLLAAVTITVLYLVAETLWNRSLVAAVGDVATTRGSLDLLVLEGRLVAAFGLSWAALKSQFLKRTALHGAVVNAFLVALTTVALYVGIGRCYELAIDALPARHALSAYKLASYRQSSNSSLSPVAAVLQPIALLHPQSAAAIDQAYAVRRGELLAALAEKLDPAWERIQQLRLSGGDARQLAATFEAGYQRFLEASRRVEATGFGRGAAVAAFKIETGGLEADPHASRERFARALSDSRFIDQARLGEWWLRTGGSDRDVVAVEIAGVQLMASELVGLDHEAFRRLVAQKLGPLVDEKLPTLDTIKANDTTHDVVAAVVLPPLAMTLSLVAVIANAGSLLGLLLSKVPVIGRRQLLFPAAAVVAALAMAPRGSLVGLETAQAHLESAHPIVALAVEKVAGLEELLLGATQ